MKNQLHSQKSRYLLDHKNNPVHWQLWGAEAFELAKKENKPILLSIGYSSCHWCHVMAHESFMDAHVADVINSLFIPIKLDREEYPDIDSFYMSFSTQTFGAGGWPLNVYINPNRAPFFAMTYLPKDQLIEALYGLSEEYKGREELQKQEIEQSFHIPSISDEESKSILQSIAPTLPKNYGGPQFPQASFLLYALDKKNTKQVEEELTHYITKGLFDHIEGGFFRYSVDPNWQIPHYEKMLYDQAILLLLCSEFHAKSPSFKTQYAIEKTISWLTSHMRLESGLYGSATDADTKQGEGYYYTIESTKDKKTESLFDFNFAGVHQGRVHPWINLDFYQKNKKECDDLVLSHKEKRKSYQFPELDKKSVFSWNAMLGYALLRAGNVLKNKLYRAWGIEVYDSLNTYHIKNNHFYHVVYDKTGFYSQEYLEDYASYLLLLSEIMIIKKEERNKVGSIIKEIKKKFLKENILKNTTDSFFDNFNLLQDTPFPSGGSMLINALEKLDSEESTAFLPSVRGIIKIAKEDPYFFGFWLKGLNCIYT